MRTHNKLSNIKALIIVMMSILFISACSTSNNGNSAGSNNGNNAGNASANSNEGKAIISSDGQVQLTLEEGWIEEPAFKEQALLGVSDKKNEKYAMVNMILKSAMSDNATLDDFKTLFNSNIQVTITNPVETNSKTITVDSTEAQLFEITGEAQKIKVHYLVALLEKGGSFYQIVTWSTQDQFESHKEELLRVIESFNVLRETPIDATPAPNTGSTDTTDDKNTDVSTMTSEDKKMEITVPAFMSHELELSPLADIQASRALQEEYMMVLREGKDNFADDFTLTEYYNLINESMSTSLTNAVGTEPKEVQINGQPALQYELSGEIDKVKISYLITLVETEGNFTQVLFWTIQNRMDEKRDMFINATNTFKEVQ